jgi:Rieske Fe-S protein
MSTETALTAQTASPERKRSPNLQVDDVSSTIYWGQVSEQRPLRSFTRSEIHPAGGIEAAQNSVTAGKVSELALNSGKIFKFGNKPGLLIRSASGEFKAFSAVCTHLDCIVQYEPEKKQIWCACHNGQYNLNGQNVGGPAPRPLEEYVVNTRGEEIVVSKA